MTGDLAQILRVPAVPPAATGEEAEPPPLTLYGLVQKAEDQWLETHEYYQLLKDLLDDVNGEHWCKAATFGPRPDGCWLRLISFADYNNFRTGKNDGHIWIGETEKSLKGVKIWSSTTSALKASLHSCRCLTHILLELGASPPSALQLARRRWCSRNAMQPATRRARFRCYCPGRRHIAADRQTA